LHALLGGAREIFNQSRTTRATNQYQEAGIYYDEPSRHFSFDANFNDFKKRPAGSWTAAVVSLP
jgi:hypothetical protein